MFLPSDVLQLFSPSLSSSLSNCNFCLFKGFPFPTFDFLAFFGAGGGTAAAAAVEFSVLIGVCGCSSLASSVFKLATLACSTASWLDSSTTM